MIKDWSRIEIMKEKIGIISDTHGLLRPEVLEILKDCKYILHAGDVNKDEILDVLRSMGISMWSVEIMIKTGRKISAPV